MSDQAKVLEVWLDCDLGPACQVGTLAHDRGQVRFHYDRNWLKNGGWRRRLTSIRTSTKRSMS
jgi:hypothetical protein